MFVPIGTPLSLATFYYVDLSSSVSSCVLVRSLLITSISKLNNSTYLSVAFQFNDDFLKADLQCLCVHASPTLAVFALKVNPALSSFIVITADVASWIKACVTAVWIASDSAISAWISVIIFLVLLEWLSLPFWEYYSLHIVILLASDVITLM